MATTDDAEVLHNAPAKFTSSMWKHFKLNTTNTECVCNLCKTRMPYRGNTANMQSHIKRHHSSVNLGPAKTTTTKRPFNGTLSSTSAAPTGMIPSIFVGQLAAGSLRSRTITRSLTKYLVNDLRPFSVVENKGFRGLIQKQSI
jgi:hypothetical protein